MNDEVAAKMERPLKHWFVSNRAFTQMTGIRRVCGACGAGDPPRNSVCPGKRPTRADQ